MKCFFACLKPVQISLQRIDFAVVGDITKWLRQFPGGKCIGGKTGMNQARMPIQSFVGKVREIIADLQAGKLPFVHNSFIGK